MLLVVVAEALVIDCAAGEGGFDLGDVAGRVVGEGVGFVADAALAGAVEGDTSQSLGRFVALVGDLAEPVALGAEQHRDRGSPLQVLGVLDVGSGGRAEGAGEGVG